MARLPPPRDAVHRGLWIPDLREGDDSPLSTSLRLAVPGISATQQLPTQKLHPCVPNGTFRTPCVPRARLNTPDGKTTEWKSEALPAYQRRTRAADALIAGAYLFGTNTRRVRRALAAVFRGAVSKDTGTCLCPGDP
jgi:hypothetical protein